MTRPPSRGYDDDINKTTKGLIIMTISLIKATDYCSNCGADCAPSPSIEVDPLCTACIADFRARDINLPLPTPHDFAFALKEPIAAHACNSIAWFDPTYY